MTSAEGEAGRHSQWLGGCQGWHQGAVQRGASSRAVHARLWLLSTLTSRQLFSVFLGAHHNFTNSSPIKYSGPICMFKFGRPKFLFSSRQAVCRKRFLSNDTELNRTVWCATAMMAWPRGSQRSSSPPSSPSRLTAAPDPTFEFGGPAAPYTQPLSPRQPVSWNEGRSLVCGLSSRFSVEVAVRD